MNLSLYNSIVFCTAPILSSYLFFISGVSIADALMIISLGIFFLSGKLLRSKKLIWVVLFFIVLFMHLVFTGILGSDLFIGYFRLVKFFIIVTFLIVVYDTVDRDLLTSCLKWTISLVILGFFVQHFLHLTQGIRLPLMIPFLPLVNSDISLESINAVFVNNFRPGGLFLEPAHLSYYLFFSGLFLQAQNSERRSLLMPLIIFVLLASLSSFGFFAALILFFLWLRVFDSKSNFLIIICLLSLLPFYYTFILESFSGIPQIARLLDPNSVALTGRLEGGEEQFNSLSDYNKTWGLGYANFQLDGGFVSGINFLRLSFGTVGTNILFTCFVIMLLFNIRIALHLLLLFSMLFASSYLFTTFLLIAFLPLFRRNRYYEN